MRIIKSPAPSMTGYLSNSLTSQLLPCSAIDLLERNLTQPRHQAVLQEAAERLGRAIEAELLEMSGEDLRLVLRVLGLLVGTMGAENIMEVIFRQFGIGR